MSETIVHVRESYRRCISSGIIATFYEIFLASDPSIKPMFAKTDFKAQHELLKAGIHLAILFADDQPVGINALKRLRETHGSGKMNIPRKLYANWKASFLQAIEKTDPEFSPQVRRAWDSVLQKTIDYMTSRVD